MISREYAYHRLAGVSPARNRANKTIKSLFLQIIVMIGATAHICGHLIYAHAQTENLLYVGATVAAFGPVVAPLIRSMTSKILPADERGLYQLQ